LNLFTGTQKIYPNLLNFSTDFRLGLANGGSPMALTSDASLRMEAWGMESYDLCDLGTPLAIRALGPSMVISHYLIIGRVFRYCWEVATYSFAASGRATDGDRTRA
jgi:hypothetical protein